MIDYYCYVNLPNCSKRISCCIVVSASSVKLMSFEHVLLRMTFSNHFFEFLHHSPAKKYVDSDFKVPAPSSQCCRGVSAALSGHKRRHILHQLW